MARSRAWKAACVRSWPDSKVSSGDTGLSCQGCQQSSAVMAGTGHRGWPCRYGRGTRWMRSRNCRVLEYFISKARPLDHKVRSPRHGCLMELNWPGLAGRRLDFLKRLKNASRHAVQNRRSHGLVMSKQAWIRYRMAGVMGSFWLMEHPFTRFTPFKMDAT